MEPGDSKPQRVLQVQKVAEDTGERTETLEDEEKLGFKETEESWDARGLEVKRESKDFQELRGNMERTGWTDWMEKKDFTDFVGERDKKVTLAIRVTQASEALLGKMARRASQGIPVTQEKTATSKARRARKENEEDKG